MTSQVEPFVGLELKYCEQCGGLWLRRQGSANCYCAACARFLEEIPPRAHDNRRRGGSGPLRRRMRKQYREPGTELAPLDYVLAKQHAELEQRADQPVAALEVVAEPEVSNYDGL